MCTYTKSANNNRVSCVQVGFVSVVESICVCSVGTSPLGWCSEILGSRVPGDPGTLFFSSNTSWMAFLKQWKL